MATARKAWFRVADALTKEDLSNDELATLIRLMGELNTRWARDGLTAEESGCITLRAGDLLSCTGSASLARARRIVHALAARVSLIVSTHGTNTTIEWRKWPEFQGLTAREQGKPGENSTRGLPPTPTPPHDAHAHAPKERDEGGEKPPGQGDHPTGSAETRAQLALVGDPPDPKPPDIEPEVFAEVCRVAGEYHDDGKPRAWTLTPQRRARMRSVAEDYGPAAPVDSFHGFVAYHAAGGRWPQQLANFTPDTVWRASNVAKYLEADAEARDRGQTRPYAGAPAEPAWMAQTRRIAARGGIKL